VQHKIRGNVLYPQHFQDKLTEATRLFLSLYDKETITWRQLTGLYHIILNRERDALLAEGVNVPLSPQDGKVMYDEFAYRAAAEVVLKPASKGN
jgi:hypothetical protein